MGEIKLLRVKVNRIDTHHVDKEVEYISRWNGENDKYTYRPIF